MFAVGIDLGGTRVKLVAIGSTDEVLAERVALTGPTDGSGWVERIHEALVALQDDCGGVAGSIGLAAPGLAAEDGHAIASHQGRFAGLQGLVWAQALRVQAPLRVLNDAHAALLGEAWRGAARGCRDALLLTLGTGVGGALLCEGRLLRGHLGRAGHVGHISLDPDGPPTATTAMRGALEDAIGNCTLERRSAGRFRDTKALVEAHLAGDQEARAVWLRSIWQLACAVASLVNVVDPQRVVIGGGIALAGDALFVPLREALAQVEWRPFGRGVEVVPASLGDRAGALGAAFAGRSGFDVLVA